MAPEPLAARSRHHRSDAAPVEQTETKPKDAVAASQVPLPQPRPAAAPPRASTETAKTETTKGKDAPAKGDAKDNAKESAAPEPQPPSACRLALTDEIAIAPSIPSIHGPGACGGDDLVRLEAVVLPDKARVALTPPAIMRCTMATALVNWIRNDVAPEVAKLGSEIRALDNFDSYECRGRNGVAGATLSEHGKANAIDVHGFKLADGRMIELTDRTQPRELREAVLRSACARFPTVLGPDSDWHHEDHIHLDLIERRSNYRICQWDVLDPLPKVAPLLPEQRPSDAPPREIAEVGQGEKAKDQAAAKTSKGQPSAADDKTGNDNTGKSPKQDAKPETKPSTGKAATETGDEPPASPKSASSVAPGARTATDKDRPESKPSADAGKSATVQAAPDRPSAKTPADEKAAAGKARAEKSSSEKASEKVSSERASSERASNEKASRKKVAGERPPRRHRHRARTWNPFASFF
jgi:hypothetical protein